MDIFVPELWSKECATLLEENLVISSLIHDSIPRVRPKLFTREISAVPPVVIYPEDW